MSQPNPLSPKPILEYTKTGIIYHDGPEGPRAIDWETLRAVMIETTDDGPFSTDVWWIFIDERGHCILPSEVVDNNLLAQLQELPEFDHEAVIQAMASVENKLFLCWKRQ